MPEDNLPPPLGFDLLRQKGIAAAQAASGEYWTDYNLHDPGVTLLEQTCYALTEIAYQNDHPVRDLLTDASGRFDPVRLGIPGPMEVLPGRPVTARDLARCLTDLEAVERVFVSPAPVHGLVDLVVIPARGVEAAEAVIVVREAFEDLRLVGSDVHRILPAEPHPAVIEARIALLPLARPERVAAEIVHRVALVASGLVIADVATGMARHGGASRSDVFDDPARIWPAVGAEAGGEHDFDPALAAIGLIEGVASVEAFRVLDAMTGLPPGPEITRVGHYLDILLPSSDRPESLVLTLEGSPIALDLQRVDEEFQRIVAYRLAQRGNRLDPRDWDALRPGRHRAMSRARPDDTLPSVYRTGGLPAERAAMAAYRQMTEGYVNALAAPLGRLPDIYAAADMDARLSGLGHLLALKCDQVVEHFPPGREDYLARLADFNRCSGTADRRFGLAARLACLADMEAGGDPSAATRGSGLVVDAAAPLPEPGVERARLLLPVRPLDMLVPLRDDVAPADPATLVAQSPWVVEGRVSPALFATAARPDAWLVARDRAGDWQVLLDPGGAGLYGGPSFARRADAIACANALRLAWTNLNRSADRLLLIEDVRLRGSPLPGGAAAPFTAGLAHAVMAGYTLRGADPAYRQWVEDLILTWTPAHVLIQPLWLGPAELAEVVALLDDQESGPRLRQQLRAFEATSPEANA